MALETIRELVMQPRFMGLAVAVLAAHGRTVLTLVTGDTIELPMFGRGSGQHLVHLAVAGGTVDRRQPLGKVHRRRRVSWVTNQTVGIGHLRTVRRMAFGAVLFAAMGRMAEGAIDLKMLARLGLHRLINLTVTTQAGSPGFLGLAEIELQRRMRSVAVETVADQVMAVRLGIVTGHACGHHPFGLGRMGLVAVDTGHLRLVRHPLLIDGLGHLTVARGTMGRIDFPGKGDVRRFVWRMATQAVGIGHLRCMTGMTTQALLEIAVLFMTLPAIHRRMGRGIEFHKAPDLGVTGNTDRLDLFAAVEIELQGRMGIMTGCAGLAGVMKLLQPGMTGTATQDRLLAMGFMAGVTSGTGRFLFVRSPLLGDLGGLFAVTGTTERSRHFLGIIQGRRLVRRVATQTIVVTHARCVRLMTTETGNILAMDLMTLVAVHLGVGTGQGLELHIDSGMAGNTGRLDRFHRLQVDGQRAMRRMALGAAANIEMRIVRGDMTGSTGNERGDPRLGMAGMAVGAADPWMASMAVGAANLRLMGTALPVEIRHLGGMTGAAKSRGRIAGEIDDGRLVRRMAAQTILVSHLRTVRAVALEAGQSLAMFGMTLVAAHLRMDAGEVDSLFARAFVAGDTGWTHITDTAEILDFRRVGVMALDAVFDGEVSRLGRRMTIGAGRYRPVLLMAAAATDGLMLAAGLCEKRGRTLVTGAAEVGFDLGIKSQGGRGMRRMTLLAILPGHRLGMRFVTFTAIR